MKKNLTLFFTLCLLFCGCIKEDEAISNTPVGNFETLWNLVNEQYCFLDHKAEKTGITWNEVYAKYRPMVHNKMSSEQLFEVLCHTLAELRDGHVNLYSAHDIGRYWSWHEDYPANFDEDLLKHYLDTDYKIASSIKYKILENNIGYLYYGSFTQAIGNGNLDEILHYLRTCDGLIVDVRNNSGGTLTYAEMLSERFTNERLLVGYMSHKTGKGHNDFSTPEAQYIAPSDGVRWQKKAVVLTNRSCYSATNTFVRNMKKCPSVTIMGDRTGGGSGMPFSSELPNGWGVRFSACPMFDANMQHIEFGIEPDIYVSLQENDRKSGIDTLIETACIFLKQ